jgi:hypothetical protein
MTFGTVKEHSRRLAHHQEDEFCAEVQFLFFQESPSSSLMSKENFFQLTAGEQFNLCRSAISFLLGISKFLFDVEGEFFSTDSW